MTNLFTYQDFLNELKISKDYNEIKNLESTYFVIYKENIYFFDWGLKDYVEKFKDFYKYLFDDNVIPISGMIKYKLSNITDFDSANSFFDYYLVDNPKIISGQFYSNYYNKNIPKDSVVAKFNINIYYEIKISDILNKFMKFLPGLEYFEIEDVVYHRDEILKKYGKNFNKQIKLPDKIYHGTSSQFIEDILKKGLEPKKENTVFSVKHNKYVYFTTSFKTAERYAKMSTARDFNLKTTQVILEIDSNRIDKDKIIFDFDFYNKFVGKGNDTYDNQLKNLGIPPSGDELLYTKFSNKNMGGLYKKFGYNGIILPTKINKIYYFTKNREWEKFTIPEFKEYMKKEKMS